MGEKAGDEGSGAITVLGMDQSMPLEDLDQGQEGQLRRLLNYPPEYAEPGSLAQAILEALTSL